MSDSGFVPTPLQSELAATAREFLAEHAAPSTSEPGRSADPTLWRRVGAELGWAGLTVAERHGGLGLSFADLCAVLEEAGRVLLGVPLADGAVCADGVGRLAPPEVADKLLPALAAAELAGTTAFDTSVRATDAGPGVRLSGEAPFVLHGATADLVLLWAEGEDGPVAVLLQAGALAAAGRRAVAVTDGTRPVATLSFDGVDVPGEAVLARGAVAEETRALLRAVRATALAAESAGGADRALEMARAYALERRQFGRVIGSFQAVKHKLANVLVLAEHARTAARHAAAAAPGDAELVRRAAIAKAYCGDAFVRATAENIQVHGGIGFTWEHPAHLYYKRAALNSTLVWSTVACRDFVRRSLFG